MYRAPLLHPTKTDRPNIRFKNKIKIIAKASYLRDLN